MPALSVIVNSTGLIMDIAAGLLLWQFGLPPDVRRDGQSFLLLESTDQTEIEKAKRYDRWSHLAIGLLILGFLLQLVSNFIP